MVTSPTKPGFGLPPESGPAAADPEAGTNLLQSCNPGHEALQALLAFSTLQEQVRFRRESEAAGSGDAVPDQQQFALYEVLQLVSERALALTGADGVAIALVLDGDIICRAASGPIAPDVGARLDPRSGFSGECYRSGEVIRCDDAETDPRVDVLACRRLNTRSMVAIPLHGRKKVLGLLEAFSTEAYGFNDSDVRSLNLLAELILGAMKPEEEEELESTAPVVVDAAVSASSEPQPDNATIEPQIEPIKTVVEPEPEAEFRMHGILAAMKSESSQAPSDAESFPALAPASEPALGVPATFLADQETLDSPLFSEYQPHQSSSSGWKFVVVLVIAAALAAGGVWWKLHSSTNPPLVAAAAPKTSPPMSPAPAPAQSNLPGAPSSSPSQPAPTEPLPTESTHDDAASASATPRSVLPLLTGVRHWESGESTTVVIDLQDQVQYEVHRLTSPQRIYFDLHDTDLAQGLDGKIIEVGDSLLLRIRVAQPMPGISRVVLETKDVSTFSVSLEQNPYRLIAEIRGPGSERKSGTKLDFLHDYAQPDQSRLASTMRPPSKEDLQLRARIPQMRVVIDAGHGGWDLGTVGRKGLLEKDLVLEVTQRLGKLLKNRLSAEVIYTRDDDTYIPLEKRAEIANQAQADLFISVHANYSDYPSARGVETYYTNFSSPADSLEIERRENATARTVPVGGVASGGVPASGAFRERMDESRRLAASVERALYGTLAAKSPGIRDRGVKEAGFVVLTGTSMPAILAEVSFVSSPADEENLRSSVYREDIAEALYKGIARYAANPSHVHLASTSGKPTGR
jgi:N-acetylmuramoyl-L-alanine amidase